MIETLLCVFWVTVHIVVLGLIIIASVIHRNHKDEL